MVVKQLFRTGSAADVLQDIFAYETHSSWRMFAEHHKQHYDGSAPEMIGHGNMATVYRLANGHILKCMNAAENFLSLAFLKRCQHEQDPHLPTVHKFHFFKRSNEIGVEMDHLYELQSTDEAPPVGCRSTRTDIKEALSHIEQDYPVAHDVLSSLAERIVSAASCIDLYRKNYMKRADGTLVFNDPIYG